MSAPPLAPRPDRAPGCADDPSVASESGVPAGPTLQAGPSVPVDPSAGADAAAASAAAAAALTRRGIRFMVAAMACFIVNDAIVKHVSQSLPSGQLIFVRGVMATALILVVARAQSVRIAPRALAHPWVAGRAAIDSAATFAYLISLFHLPLANATAINMASPLFIVALAVPLLGERVDGARWAAVIAGFLGVLLVIQPSVDGFNAWALLCLFGTLLHALRDLATRRIPAGVPSLTITFATAASVTAIAGLTSSVQGWRPFGAWELGLLATASVFLAGGYHLIIRSTRAGDMSAIAPWRYTGLLWAVLAGWMIWGDIPNALAWAGIALLMAAGLYLIRRERRRA